MIASALLAFVSAVYPASPNDKVSEDCAKFVEVLWTNEDATTKLLGHLLSIKQFATFEEASACLIASTNRFDSGRTGASAVYLTLRKKMAPPEEESANRQLIKEWREALPESTLVAFADARLSYASAWNVRGKKFASLTPDAKFREFHRLLVQTKRQLDQAPAASRNTPLWHNLMLATLHDLPDPEVDPYTVFETAVSRWPTYFDFYEVQVSRLTPRWGGDWELVEAFVNEWTGALRRSEGESTYARLYISLLNQAPPRVTRLNWNRMKVSLGDLLKRFPSRPHQRFAASFACEYGDLDLLRSMLKRDEKYIEVADWLSSDAEARCYDMMRVEFPMQRLIRTGQ